MLVRIRNKTPQIIPLLVTDEHDPTKIVELRITSKDAEVIESSRLGPNYQNLEDRGILVSMPIEDTTPQRTDRE